MEFIDPDEAKQELIKDMEMKLAELVLKRNEVANTLKLLDDGIAEAYTTIMLMKGNDHGF